MSGTIFWVESEGTPSVTVFGATETDIPNIEDKHIGDEIEYEGESYSINRVIRGRIEMPMEDEKPVFSNVHDKLEDDVREYLQNHEVSTF